MAGMDWFRWHHGSVTDPKFQLVARKSGASLPDVLAVWAYILETASQSVERGDFGLVDCEALDCLFGFPATETRTAAILKAMQERALVEGSRVASWEKRQPKREREDPTNADRQAAFRAKQNQVTPGNAIDDQKKPREEKRREEKSNSVPIGTGDKPPTDRDIVFANGVPLLTVAGVAEKNARSMLAGLCKSHGEGAVASVLADCARCRPIEPVAWIQAALKGIPGGGGKQSALEARNRAVADEWAKGESHATQ